MPVPVLAQTPAMQLEAQILGSAPMDLRSFYASEGNKSLWVAPDGSVDQAAKDLLQLVDTAQYDGVDPASLNRETLAAAIDRLQQDRSPAALTQAEVALSSTLVAYVKAMRQPTGSGMVYEHPNLQPFAPSTQSILEHAAKAASLDEYITKMEWMHPLYAPVRQALLSGDAGVDPRVLEQNLARLRAIPRNPGARYIVVDAAGSKLYMYEGDRVVDSMRVVTGKPDMPTPMYSGYVRYAIFNPYWYVPEDLVPQRIAPNVIKQGMPYIKRQGYEVISDYGPEGQILDPMKVDWHAVAKGTVKVKMRQLPNAANSMGKVKYEFPNVYGIYLHDTPEKELLKEDTRHYSAGCIRLEDAPRLGRWLLSGDLPTVTSAPEQEVDLKQPVPIYVTYLTAHQDDTGHIALGPDPYGRDKPTAGASTPALALQAP